MATSFAPWQAVALSQNFEHFCMWGGIAVGKTFTGSHFSIKNIEEQPGLTGLIGANTYDQLSQATLRELLFWLDEYKYDYVIDQRPPLSWGGRKEFKTYKNILSIRPKSQRRSISTIFTRVLSDPDALRGIEFSWYWCDETRDTPENTHDVLMSRMRESKTYRKGLITSTTAGEDWAYQRFIKNCRKGQRLYGSMHIPTEASVKAGIIAPEFYNGLRQTYSELMAMQELDALHVNVRGGRAYYSAGDHNKARIAPWGDAVPSRDRPLIVGCDFNYQPAPCVWMVGQLGPNEPDGRGGLWSDHIHWFSEIAMVEASTPQMTMALIGRFPRFTYKIYGDSSGKRGTTSNAGQNDYMQMNQVFQNNNALAYFDVDQSNPHVKDRVENMCRILKNSVGETRMTYDPVNCPLFDSDLKQVGWKVVQTMNGRARLDDTGNKQLTHASDGAGYAVWKIFPFISRIGIGMSVERAYSGILSE